MRTELHELKEVEEKVRPGEEEVWIRQAAKCSSGYAGAGAIHEHCAACGEVFHKKCSYKKTGGTVALQDVLQSTEATNTIGKVGKLLKSHSNYHIHYLLLFCLFVFLVLWLYIR